MARTALTSVVAPGSYPVAGVTVNFADADVSNKNSVQFTGAELLIARNTHVSDPATITITSYQNSRKRTKDITAESIAAGDYRVYGPFTQAEGWQQADGKLYFEASASDVEFAVVRTQ